LAYIIGGNEIFISNFYGVRAPNCYEIVYLSVADANRRAIKNNNLTQMLRDFVSSLNFINPNHWILRKSRAKYSPSSSKFSVHK